MGWGGFRLGPGHEFKRKRQTLPTFPELLGSLITVLGVWLYCAHVCHTSGLHKACV